MTSAFLAIALLLLDVAQPENRIPNRVLERYAAGMSRQIAVRLPDDIVDYLDLAVTEGRDSSRAAVITRALERERRREVALRDVRILSEKSTDVDDLDELARYGATLPTDVP